MTLEKIVLYLTRIGLCVSQFPAPSDSQADNRSPDSQYRQSKIGGFRLPDQKFDLDNEEILCPQSQKERG
jgi:hypothetical protein